MSRSGRRSTVPTLIEITFVQGCLAEIRVSEIAPNERGIGQVASSQMLRFKSEKFGSKSLATVSVAFENELMSVNQRLPCIIRRWNRRRFIC